MSESRHSGERCPFCKDRIAELLTRIYGACERGHSFGWPTRLASYESTSIAPVLREVAQYLMRQRGYGLDEFVRSDKLAPCDYWVPDPGFIVEFDESQHFTNLRKVALSAYVDTTSLGFSIKRWMELCEQYDRKDNNPLYRDEQRAWYDTLRDLIPSIKGLQPTVRLHAGDEVWCSLDVDSKDDQERFVRLLHARRSPSGQTMTARRSISQSESTLRVAMVFPAVGPSSESDSPITGSKLGDPNLPTPDSLAGEDIDFVLFPEAYISKSDKERVESLKDLASDLGVPLLVGASDDGYEKLLRFEPGSSPETLYTKHTSARAVAFGLKDWDPNSNLQTFQLSGETLGATICHDHYLGLLPGFLGNQGMRLWLNLTGNNVVDIKWASVMRLRAVENRVFALCTLHDDKTKKNRTHPFAFAPNGEELLAREAGSGDKRPISQSSEAGKVYIVDIDMAAVEGGLDWSKVLPAKRSRRKESDAAKLIRVRVEGGKPAIIDTQGRSNTKLGSLIETDHGSVYVGVVPEEKALDAAECFRVIDEAKKMKAAPIIWNHWERIPADSAACLATLMMGRAIECCAPIVISDSDGIREVVELSNSNKYPARRIIESPEKATVDIKRAWGLPNAFNMVTKSPLTEVSREDALKRYQTLMQA